MFTDLLRSRPRVRPPLGQCEVCREFGHARLCRRCVARFAPAVPRCGRCAAQVPPGTATCGACLHEPPLQQCAVTVADYAFPWDRLVVELKFNGQVDLAGPLAECLAGAVQRAAAHHAVDLVAPVPLSPARLRERGFNQAWEIARRVAAQTSLPARPTLLQRPLDGAHQADLPRAQRAVNLRHAFFVEPADRAAVHGRRIAIVDDVLTTGATAREAAAALLQAGAAAVQVWTIARTA